MAYTPPSLHVILGLDKVENPGSITADGAGPGGTLSALSKIVSGYGSRVPLSRPQDDDGGFQIGRINKQALSLESRSIEMKNSNWYDVLEPREAVIAGAIGFAIVFTLARYANHIDYVIDGMHPSEYRGFALAAAVCAFAAPYLAVRYFIKRRSQSGS